MRASKREQVRRQRRAGQGAPHAPASAPPRISIDAPADQVLADHRNALANEMCAYVERQTRGVTQIARLTNQTQAPLPQFPVYDWGHLSDIASGRPDVIREDEWMKLDREAIGLQMRGELRLPHPGCVFLFRFGETRNRPPAINMVFLTESDDEICGVIFTRQPDLPVPMSYWCLTPVAFSLGRDGMIGFAIHPFTEHLDDDVVDEQRQDAASRASDCRVALMLLAAKGPTIHRETITPLAPRTGHQEPAEAPTILVLRLGRPVSEQPLGRPEPGHTGIVQRPHWKRGFWAQRKATGKTYWVPPRAVHGGGDRPPIYAVER